MTRLLKTPQGQAMLFGGGLLVVSGALVAARSWRWAVIAALPVLALLVVMVAHTHRRLGYLIRATRPGGALANDVSERLDQTDELLRQWIDDSAPLVNRLDVLSNQLVARFDAAELSLRLLGQEMSRASSQLDERARQLVETAARPGKDAQALRELLSDLRKLSDETHALHERLDQLQQDLLSESDAEAEIQRRFAVEGARPLLAGWALSPRAMLQTLDWIVDRDAKLIVECGSGTSTLLMAAAVRERPGAKVVALEHEADHAARTEHYARINGLDDIIDVRLAPLEPICVAGDEYRWYARDAWADLLGIDVLLVDGPPKATGLRARYPALPLLLDHLAEEAIILLDDVDRPEERRILRTWDDEFDLSLLPSFTQKLAVMRISRGGSRSDARAS